jgi:hypothetical protein
MIRAPAGVGAVFMTGPPTGNAVSNCSLPSNGRILERIIRAEFSVAGYDQALRVLSQEHPGICRHASRFARETRKIMRPD